MSVTVTTANRPKILNVRPDEVTVDLRVQRPLDGKRVAALVANFRPEALGVPTVSLREDGTKICLDGQTRFAALKELGQGGRTVPCSVYVGLDLQQEAELFRLLNDAKRLTPVNLFLIALTEGDPVAVGADKMLKVYGWTSEPGKVNSCNSVSTLANCYEKDATAVRRTLLLLSTAYGPTSTAVQANLLKGVWMFMARYGDTFQVEVEKLREAVAKQPGGPQALIGRARGNAKTRSITVPDSVADILVGIYNTRRRSGAVPAWQTA